MFESISNRWEQIQISEKFPGLTLSEFSTGEDGDGSFIFGSISEEGIQTNVATARYSLDTDMWSTEYSPVADDEAKESFERRNGGSILNNIADYLNANFPAGPKRI